MNLIKTAFAAIIGLGLMGSLAACSTDADVASKNLSTAADLFQINRRIVFYNGITDKYIMTIEGLCSLGNNDPPRELTVTCKTGPMNLRSISLVSRTM